MSNESNNKKIVKGWAIAGVTLAVIIASVWGAQAAFTRDAQGEIDVPVGIICSLVTLWAGIIGARALIRNAR